MTANLPAVQPTANRRATQNEIEHAVMALRSLNDAIASLIKTDHAAALGNDIAIVVTDFSKVADDARVLLVPSGTYDVPIAVLEQAQYIVGLAWERADYPVLKLHGERAPVTNSDTLEEADLCVAPCSASLLGIVLDAPQPTVLEVFLGDGSLFSDVFFNVQWRENVDAYDQAACTAHNGRDWLITAYGSSLCRQRNIVEKGLDAIHEGAMNSIDNIFRPLVRAGETVDRLLGLK